MRTITGHFKNRLNQEKRSQILIVGGGDLSRYLAKNLVKKGEEVVVITRSFDALKRFEDLDVLVLTQKELTSWKEILARTKVICCLSSSEEYNLYRTLQAKLWYKDIKTIALLTHGELSELEKEEKIDLLLRPEQLILDEVRKILGYSIKRIGDKILLFIKLNFSSTPKKVLSLLEKQGKNLILSLVFRKKRIMPLDRDALKPGDEVFLVFSIPDFRIKKGILPSLLRNKIFVLSGGTDRNDIASGLKNDGNEVYLVTDNERREEIADIYPEIKVFNTHPLDFQPLLEEGVSRSKALLAFSRDENLNLIWSRVGRALGVDLSIPLVLTERYASLARLIKLSEYFYLNDILYQKIKQFVEKPELNFLIEDKLCVAEIIQKTKEVNSLPSDLFYLKGFSDLLPEGNQYRLILAGKKEAIIKWYNLKRG